MAATDETRGFRITGRVQGVDFRAWTQRVANELGLRGTVRNCPDGSVEVVASGRPARMARLRELLQEGAPGARVATVTEFEPPAGGMPSASFEVLL